MLNSLVTVGVTAMIALPGIAQKLPGGSGTPEAGGKPGAIAGGALKAQRNAFIENKGQWSENALFLHQQAGLDYWVTPDGIVMDRYAIYGSPENTQRIGQVVTMRFTSEENRRIGSPEGKDAFGTPRDYVFMDSRKGVKGVRGYREAYTRGVMPGIDARYYLQGTSPRFDLEVAAGADTSKIEFTFNGANEIQVTQKGEIGILTNQGWIYQGGLSVYQTVNGAKRSISAKFVKKSDTTVGLELGKFDPTKKLVIDPLVYGTYIGGDDAEGYDQATNVVATNLGGTSVAYVAGNTTSQDFPVTAGPYGVNNKDSQDSFIVALRGDAYDVVYVAFVGGIGDESSVGVQVDQYGNVWLGGSTTSEVFPVDLRQRVRINPALGAPVFGSFNLNYRGVPQEPLQNPVTTAPLDWNATSGAISTALNNLSNVPPAGFVTSGGALPPTPVVITTTGQDLGPLKIRSRMQPYTLARASAASYTLRWVDPRPADVGFRPKSGNFRIQILQGTTLVAITSPIPWNATTTDVQDALDNQLGGPGSTTVTGAALPAGTITIVLNNPFNALNLTFDALTLNGGGYVIGGPTQNYLVRFKTDSLGSLDPFTQPVVARYGSDEGAIQNVKSFAIKPVPTQTGNVEFVLAGTAVAPIAEIPNAPPGGATFGYVLNVTYNVGGNTLAINPAKSFYVGETNAVTVAGATIDGQGTIYVAGTVKSTINANTGPASTNFKTTTPVYTNGNLLRLDDAFVRKYSASGQLLYSALLGGSGKDEATSLNIDTLGNLYVAGVARSSNFPRTSNSFGQVFSNARIAFLTKVNNDASQLLFSTNLRTTGPATVKSVAVDSRGNIYCGGVVGFDLPPVPPAPTIPGSVPVTPIAPVVPGQEAAVDATYNFGNQNYPAPPPFLIPSSTTDGFLMVVNAPATGLLFSTYIGENTSEDVNQVYVDSANSVYVAGYSQFGSINFPNDTGAGAIGNGPNQGPYGLGTAYISTLAFKQNYDGADGYLLKFRVALPIINSLTLNPTQIAGGLGATSTGTVTLRNPAPLGGSQITIRVLQPNVARLTTSGATSIRVTIPENQTTATFTLFSRQVLQPAFCDVRAEFDGDFLIARLNVRPWLESLILNADQIPGGNQAQGTVTLFQPAPTGGVTVSLSTDLPGLISYPTNSITIPAGQQSANFDINTKGVGVPTDTNITAVVESVGASQTLKLLPASVQSVTFNPPSVGGGESSTGTVFLDGEAVTGSQITLTQSGQAITIPATLSLIAGDRQATFTAQTPTIAVPSTTSIVTASLNGTSSSGTLTIEQLLITGIQLSSNSVLGGTTVDGTITLNRPAGPGGVTIPLNWSDPFSANLLPQVVTIAAGQTVGTFQVITKVVGSTRTVTISTNKPELGGSSVNLIIRGVDWTFAITPGSVSGGANATGTITFKNGEVAPPNGMVFTLSNSDASAATVPASVTIAGGSTSGTFTIQTKAVPTDRVITVTATDPGGRSYQATLGVVSPVLIAFNINPLTPTGGSIAVGTVTLAAPAPVGGQPILLSSSNPGVASVPSQVVIPAGNTSTTFNIQTSPVTSNQSVIITAGKNGQSLNRTITVQVSKLVSLTFSPQTVLSGQSSTATLTIDQNAPAGGLVINLVADKPEFVGFPSTVTIPAGQKTVNFTVTANPVTRLVGVVFTATVQASGNTTTGTLFIDRNTN